MVSISVPATSANLGPGFDCLGVALGLHLKVRFAGAERSRLEGRGPVRSVDDSLIHRSFRAAFAECGKEPPPVHIHVAEDYPSGRGMGASASAIVSGLAGAAALAGLPLSTDDLGALAIRIEGHPDNVLPALLGGLVLNVGDGWLRFEPSASIAPLLLVSPKGFKTQAARKALPEAVPREQAVSNAAATAALLSILAGSQPSSQLMAATEDRLHQPFRLPLMPESRDLLHSLRAHGIAAALSGAGPSVICLVESKALDEAAGLADSLMPRGWSLVQPGWDVKGAVTEL